MPRHAARIRHDEVARMVKAVLACGLPVARVTYNGDEVHVVIGENTGAALDAGEPGDGLLREPKP